MAFSNSGVAVVHAPLETLAEGLDQPLVEDGLARAHVMIYELHDAPAAYPSITSAGTDELIGWGALSGDGRRCRGAGQLFAVSDSVYGGAARIYSIDATQTPARITDVITVTRNGDAVNVAVTGTGGDMLAAIYAAGTGYGEHKQGG
ncbi:MAG: esterase-like activity of phytase family protein [Chloroflexaceae bacterium]|nr:esterase-like activity of phytase family protein [Chloroflexaceae bacterium]